MAHFLLVLAAFSAPGVRAAPAPHTTWTAYGGSADSMQYSALQEVDKAAVGLTAVDVRGRSGPSRPAWPRY